MKKKLFIIPVLFVMAFFASCGDDDLRHEKEKEHHYIVHYIPWNNTLQQVNKNQATPLEVEVMFESVYVRGYDAEVNIYIKSEQRISNGQVVAEAAVPGTDFTITDESGKALPAGDNGALKLTFEQAKKTTKKLYINILDNAGATSPVYFRMDLTSGDASAEDLNTLINKETGNYKVSAASQAYSRPIQINP